MLGMINPALGMFLGRATSDLEPSWSSMAENREVADRLRRLSYKQRGPEELAGQDARDLIEDRWGDADLDQAGATEGEHFCRPCRRSSTRKCRYWCRRQSAAPPEGLRSWCGLPVWPSVPLRGPGPREGRASGLVWWPPRIPRLSPSIAQGLPRVKRVWRVKARRVVIIALCCTPACTVDGEGDGINPVGQLAFSPRVVAAAQRRASAIMSASCSGQSCRVAGSKSAPLGQTSVWTSRSSETALNWLTSRNGP